MMNLDMSHGEKVIQLKTNEQLQLSFQALLARRVGSELSNHKSPAAIIKSAKEVGLDISDGDVLLTVSNILFNERCHFSNLGSIF